MLLPAALCAADAQKSAPVKIIFDTDIGNDVDDVIALGMLHALASRGECELLAVTVTKHDELAGPFVDAVNTFYGRPEIPIGCIQPASTNDPGKFLPLAIAKDGTQLRYPHKLQRGSDAPAAEKLLREVLSKQPDNSVVLVQVGFFSNLAALLKTPVDSISPLTGVELVKQKVKLLSIMAGAFKAIGTNQHYIEYNVVKDIPAAQQLARDWPTPIVWSGFEIGIAAPYPAVSIERDFNWTPHHPVAEAYRLYMPPPHERPTWDPTSAFYAVRPDRGYFKLSPPGQVTVEADGFTRFVPAENGRDRFLILEPGSVGRLKEAMTELTSQPLSAQPQKR